MILLGVWGEESDRILQCNVENLFWTFIANATNWTHPNLIAWFFYSVAYGLKYLLRTTRIEKMAG